MKDIIDERVDRFSNKVVVISEFCWKYNISPKLRNDFGFDNGKIKVLDEKTFKDLKEAYLRKKSSYSDKRSLEIRPMYGVAQYQHCKRVCQTPKNTNSLFSSGNYTYQNKELDFQENTLIVSSSGFNSLDNSNETTMNNHILVSEDTLINTQYQNATQMILSSVQNSSYPNIQSDYYNDDYRNANNTYSVICPSKESIQNHVSSPPPPILYSNPKTELR